MSETRFIIIGISDSRMQTFSPEIMQAIKAAKVFSGGKRHHDIVAPMLPPGSLWIDVTVPLASVFDKYTDHDEIVVFASGDPLFFGFAATLQRAFPDTEITVYPSFNSLQTLSHRLLLPYAEMKNVSLTGRPWKNLDVALITGYPLIGILTDRSKTPAEIARHLLRYGYDNYSISVGECLGNDTERIRIMSLEETAQEGFAFPNCVILKMTHPRKRYFGLPENLFRHLEGRNNMITKMPVRLLSLSMLDLSERRVMWDVGFCTGSVSIEAKLRFPQLDIISFERRAESKAIFEENCRIFGTPGIEAVIADFLDCELSTFPAPDAVFIGGHGGRLPEMMRRIFGNLTADGIVVFNSVSDESRCDFLSSVESCGGKIQEEHLLCYDAHNPVKIIKASK
ncbi:precorrin-6y C5,15-methyltransferase (decarboxylating) subunit CbiE [Lepagella muris]|uniref:Precorrin-6y C5,15-methyltransferase (Decarboxylating) subunit CbiE n=1 Tax=Lepagella muris TaxID=3032870 RepID=A0AC61RCM6_9BACT|nr:precorrin-6y C5,15-methyltransferase (decarboxylating) subunit CbiE [Lepagella muris]ROT10071.1 precorrin-6y C5,15-methyltransferase (decarboxylating) subunit CbiE [Muribaculaceae bacterium Isolate-037 (Harlan)]TGY78262.1 precorrin-6y C5,15-methyltransferase (decarboxylating) subunit CbiE [Lepagella muris]THG53778.1 precorrin-6y C5,15-methyltransferase (decarboxylating) subunit CbiE [Bacteroidales bacterium]TKC66018.1 precorrin-6y C5,15-methyltransferase (decarboxylating) subunit CbiE [Bacte